MIKCYDINFDKTRERNWFIPYSCRCNAISGARVLYGDKPENVGCAVIAEKDTRRRVLNGSWHLDISTHNHERMDLIPSDLESDKPINFKRIFKIPYGLSLKNVYLVFEGIDVGARVSINDKLVGCTDSIGAWEFNISSYVNDGANEVMVEFDKTAHGIFGEVYILDRPKSHLINYKLDVNLNSLTLSAEANKEYGAVSIELYDANNTLVSRKDSLIKDYKVSVKMDVNEPVLWNAEKPYLYTLLIHSFNEVIPVRFGFRTYDYVNGEFVVNGKSVRLINDKDFVFESNRVLPFMSIFNEVSILKQNGINCVELDAKSCDHRFLALADELGLYVLDKSSKVNTEAFRGFKNEFSPIVVIPKLITVGYQVYDFKNCFSFTNLTDIDILYEVKTPSKTYLSGRFDLEAYPGELTEGRIDFTFPDFSFEEFFVEFSFRLKSNVIYASRGFEVGYAQIKLPILQTSPETEKSSTMPKIVCENDIDGNLNIIGEFFNYKFDMSKGSLCEMLFNNYNLISEATLFSIKNKSGESLYNINAVSSNILSKGNEYVTVLSSYSVKSENDIEAGFFSVLWAFYGSGEIGIGLTGEFIAEIPNNAYIAFDLLLPCSGSFVKYYGLEQCDKRLSKDFLCKKNIYTLDLRASDINKQNYEYVQWVSVGESNNCILIKGMPSFEMEAHICDESTRVSNSLESKKMRFSVENSIDSQYFFSFTFKPVNLECIDLLRETRTLPGISDEF